MNKVAFILVCWNNKQLLPECIKSIESQTYKHYDIYLIDNNSSDGSADFVAEKHPNVKLIRSQKNNGFAQGNNILIKLALQDLEVGYLALINTDARLSPNWTEKLVNVAKSVDKAACLQGLTLDYFDNAVVDSHHIYIAEDLQATQYGYKTRAVTASLATYQVLGVNAAAAMVTRKFIEDQPDQQLFDESFYMYLEDMDMALRAIMTGWKNYFVGGAVAYHMGSASSNERSSSFALYYTARNQPALLIKNLPLGIIIQATPAFLRNEYHFIMHLRENFSPDILHAYLRGRIVGTFRAMLYLRKRRQLRTRRTIHPEFLWTLIKNKGWIQ